MKMSFNFLHIISIKKFLILLFSVLLGNSSFSAFNQQKVDSLLKCIKTGEDDSIQVKNLNVVARDFLFNGDYKQAEQYAMQALSLSKKIGYKNGEAPSYNNLGALHQLQGNYARALEFNLAALKIREKEGDREGEAGSLQNIASICFFQGNFEDALKYDLAALEIRKELANPVYIAASYNNTAEDYQALGNYPEALKSHQASLEIKLKIGDKQGLATSYSNMANIYLKQSESLNSPEKEKLCDEAIRNHILSLNIRKEINDLQGITESYINLGGLSTRLKKITDAKKYLKAALELAQKTGYKEAIKESYKGLANLDSLNSDWQSAYNNHVSYVVTKDSILNEASSMQIAEMQVKYESEKKEKENTLLLKENEIKRLEINAQKNQKYLLLVLVLLLIFLSVFFYKSYKSRQEKKFREELLRQEKLRIKSMVLSQENERKKISEELHDGIGQMLNSVRTNVSSLEIGKQEFSKQFDSALNLIDASCRELRNISHTMMPGLLVKAGLVPAVKELTDNLSKSSKLSLYIEDDSETKLDNQVEIHLYRIIQELLSNIIKYAQANEVYLQFNRNENDFTVMLEDNGKGFDKNLLETNIGNGWSNINSRAGIINAKIEIDSQIDKGTVVFIQVPLA